MISWHSFATPQAKLNEARRVVDELLQHYQKLNPNMMTANRSRGGGNTPIERAAALNYMNLMGQ